MNNSGTPASGAIRTTSARALPIAGFFQVALHRERDLGGVGGEGADPVGCVDSGPRGCLRFGRLLGEPAEVGLRADQRDDRLVHRHRVRGAGAARALGHAAHFLRLTVQVDRGGGQPGRGEQPDLFTAPGAAAVDDQAMTLRSFAARRWEAVRASFRAAGVFFSVCR
ncbi:hypothetical protein ACIQWL_51890 [Streptomyces mirabilis]|uniref:hypothetical protein n=1 Tax=Streptomyces mirabilis TaxID=68239 RepID=UPI0007661C24